MAVPQTKLEMGEVATIWLDYKPLNALHPQREHLPLIVLQQRCAILPVLPRLREGRALGLFCRANDRGAHMLLHAVQEQTYT
eukprot:1139784-Pelagomonas_calceolata.AAC.1